MPFLPLSLSPPPPLPRPHYSNRRAAFTLVEMLIAMTLTLILVTAIAEFYAIVGDSVKDGRAMIELGGQLRSAVQRLQADLDQLTVTVAPWNDDATSSGYFEYFEGFSSDFNANATVPDNVVDATNDAQLINSGVTTAIGDGDDCLAFTVRATDAPFTGRYCSPPGSGVITSQTPGLAATGDPRILTSQLAEVVWWVGFVDGADGTGTARVWDFNEPRQLYRRQLLIRPELGQIGGDYRVDQLDQAQQALMRFWQYNDISASIRAEINPALGLLTYRIRANTLSDLSRRENRFAHMPVQMGAGNVDATFPHSLATQSNFPNVTLLLPSYSLGTPGLNETNSYVLQAPGNLAGESPGEDVALTNLLAFDVKVFDPYARVWPNVPQVANAMVALTPGDPGYSAAAVSAAPMNPIPLLGLGAYVDLNYYRYLTNAAIQVDTNLSPAIAPSQPYFAGPPAFPASIVAAAQRDTYYRNFGYPPGGVIPVGNTYVYGATYDTWAVSYERDGVDQLGIPGRSYDLATNGLDDPPGANQAPLNGVDDVTERDTAPPYAQPLRGLQVRIRVYEPSTRQVRQATVATDFVTE